MKTKYFFPLLSLLPTTVLAAASTYDLLAPLPGLSKGVTLTAYLEGAVKVTIGMAGILAVLMIVICGVQMIGSPSVSQKSASKECITSALFGLLLAISSWLILNTINTQLLSSDLSMVDLPEVVLPPPPPPADAPLPTKPGFYFRYKVDGAGPIINSPQWPTPDSCLEGMNSAKTHGDTVAQTPEGSGKECFQVFPAPPVPPGAPPAPPSGPPLEEAEARKKICGNDSCIGATPVGIKQGPCPPSASKDCAGAGFINVAGLPLSAINQIKSLPGPVLITGGTESGHATHAPNAPIFDLRKTTALDKHIHTIATQSAISFTTKGRSQAWCRYRVSGNGDWWFTDEGNHWHVCQLGQPYWFCTDKNRDGKTLPDGIAINCPR